MAENCYLHAWLRGHLCLFKATVSNRPLVIRNMENTKIQCQTSETYCCQNDTLIHISSSDRRLWLHNRLYIVFHKHFIADQSIFITYKGFRLITPPDTINQKPVLNCTKRSYKCMWHRKCHRRNRMSYANSWAVSTGTANMHYYSIMLKSLANH